MYLYECKTVCMYECSFVCVLNIYILGKQIVPCAVLFCDIIHTYIMCKEGAQSSYYTLQFLTASGFK